MSNPWYHPDCHAPSRLRHPGRRRKRLRRVTTSGRGNGRYPAQATPTEIGGHRRGSQASSATTTGLHQPPAL